MLKLLSCIFLGLSLVLWLATNFKATSCVDSDPKRALSMQNMQYHTSKVTNNRETVPEPPTTNSDGVEDVVEWLRNNIPAEVQWNTSVCPAVSVTMKAIVQFPNEPTFTVIGAINSTFRNGKYDNIGVEELGNTGLILTNIAAADYGTDTMDVSSLQSLSPAIASLANYNIARIENRIMTNLIHRLDSVDIEWFGLNAKKHKILRIGNMKVGFLAFCSIHAKCTESSFLPFAPIRYSAKVSRESIQDLKKSGVDTIIVLVYWGLEHSYFPEETALHVARHLADFPEVSVIIGHHPQHIQDHAYFGNTLVLFSPGNFIIPDNSSSICWKRMTKNQWHYRNTTECLSVHPALRHGLLERELETRVYKIYLNRGLPAVSEYTNLQLDISEKTGLRIPTMKHSYEWTRTCGKFDSHCLSCKPY